MERFVKIYNDINDLTDIWQEIFANGSDMTVFQSFQWNKNIAECFKSDITLRLRYGIRYFVCFCDEKPTVIAPLLLPMNKFNPDTFVQILGQNNGIGNLNFIYGDDVTDEDFSFLIGFITSTYGSTLRIGRLLRDSNFSRFLSEFEGAEKSEENVFIRCRIPETVEENYNNLEENAKKIADKIESNEIKANVEIYYSYDFGETEKETIKSLDESSDEIKGAKAFFKKVASLKKVKDPVINFSRNDEFVYAKMVVEGVLAGYIFGVADKNGNCSILTLKADEKQSRYQPVCIMIYELIKNAIENESFETIDFCMEYDGIEIEDFGKAEDCYSVEYKIKSMANQTQEIIKKMTEE